MDIFFGEAVWDWGPSWWGALGEEAFGAVAGLAVVGYFPDMGIGWGEDVMIFGLAHDVFDIVGGEVFV